MSSARSQESVWKSRIDPNMKYRNQEILHQFDDIHLYSSIERSAALHLYVRHETAYEKRGIASGNPRNYRSPEEVWRVGGNCGERSMLLASLISWFDDVDIRTIGLNKKNDSIGHRIIEVKFPYHPEDVRETLENFYRRTKNYKVKNPSFAWSSPSDNRHTWMIVDPGMSSYIGDISTLENSGYIKETEDSWDWYDLDSKYNL